MPDLIIKPTATSGNKLILKDQAGGAVLTTADSGADYVGTTKGTIDSTATFPAGHIVAYKTEIYSADSSNYLDPGSASTWVGTSSSLNLTHSLDHANNMLIFTLCSSHMYISTNRDLYVGIGFTSDLTGDDANIIRYAGEGPGGDDAGGKAPRTASQLEATAGTFTFKYLPATTDSKTYQPLMHGDGSTDSHLVTNNDDAYVMFSLMEVVI